MPAFSSFSFNQAINWSFVSVDVPLGAMAVHLAAPPPPSTQKLPLHQNCTESLCWIRKCNFNKNIFRKELDNVVLIMSQTNAEERNTAVHAWNAAEVLAHRMAAESLATERLYWNKKWGEYYQQKNKTIFNITSFNNLSFCFIFRKLFSQTGIKNVSDNQDPEENSLLSSLLLLFSC